MRLGKGETAEGLFNSSVYNCATSSGVTNHRNSLANGLACTTASSSDRKTSHESSSRASSMIWRSLGLMCRSAEKMLGFLTVTFEVDSADVVDEAKDVTEEPKDLTEWLNTGFELLLLLLVCATGGESVSDPAEETSEKGSLI